MLFVKAAESDNQEETVEIPVEPQGYILMSTLTAQFPGACGLKFKTEQFSWRGVRVVDDKLYPPGDDKWDEKCVYIITYPKDAKRKGDDLDINSAKSRKIERKCVDLIVLGIPWKSTEDVVRRYFEQYGEVVLCEIKRDASNNSKGFGFVRFKEYSNQCSVLGKKHFIDGRWCDVKIPNSQEPETSRKIFVGRLSESLQSKDLQEYFSQFGQVIDVYIPKPFRAFGFVTFVEADIAQSLCGESHIIKGVSVHVSRADPKEDETHSHSSHNHHSHHHHHGSHHNAGGHHSGGGGGGGGGGGYSNHHHSGSGASGGGGSHYHHRNEGNMRRFSSNGHSNSSHHIGGGSGMGMGSGGASSKSMNQIRNKMKYDNSLHSVSSGLGSGVGSSIGSGGDLYDSRHNDLRSPNMPSHSHHPHGGLGSGGIGNMQGGTGGLGLGNVGLGGSNQVSNGGAPNHPMNDHPMNMNSMMNMFNPMMAAFLQQLASQSNILPPNAQMDAAHNGAAAVVAALGHHHPPPPWTPNGNMHADYSRNGSSGAPSSSSGISNNMSGQSNISVGASGVPNGASSNNGYNQNQNSYSNSHNSRFKAEKNF